MATTPAAGLVDGSEAEKASLVIGIIGMGDMGKLYANKFVQGGWKQVVVCDLPQNYEKVKKEWEAEKRVKVLRNGHLVSRISDLVIYSVEAAYLNAAVETYGPCEW